jgi:hypothetical protein
MKLMRRNGIVATVLLFFAQIGTAIKFKVGANLFSLPRYMGTLGASVLVWSVQQPAWSKVTDAAALERFDQAYNNLVDLDKNWSKMKDGDSIRRRLGTVYTPPKCSSPLCSFASFTEKFVKNNYGSPHTRFSTISLKNQ